MAPVAPLSAIYKGARGDLRGVERILLQGSHSVETDAVQARLAAVEALEQLNDYRSVDLLIAALRRDASSSVRSAAARALGEKGDLRRRDAPLDTPSRNRALGALFPAIHQDPTDEVRMQAVEAAYKVGGSAVLQPVKSSLRRQVRAGQMPPAVQHWLVEWGVKSRLEELLIDLYPWMDLEARRSIVEHLRWHLTPSILEQLGLALSSGDPHMQELARAVLNGDPLSG